MTHALSTAHIGALRSALDASAALRRPAMVKRGDQPDVAGTLRPGLTVELSWRPRPNPRVATANRPSSTALRRALRAVLRLTPTAAATAAIGSV